MLPRVIRRAILPLAIAGGVLAACGDSDDEAAAPVIRPVKVVVIESISDELKRSYPAVVIPAQEIELSFRVSGRVVDVPVRGGAQVAEGDIIARLDSRDFEADIARLQSQRAQADAQLRSMRSGAREEDVASLTAAVNAAEARAVAAREQMARSRTLFERGSVSKARVEKDQADLSVVEAELNAKRQDLAKGRAGARAEEVEAQEAAIRGLDSQLSSAQAALADATLRAPFSGVIARRDIENFTNIRGGDAVVLLQKLDTLDLEFDVPGSDINGLTSTADLASTAVLDSLPDRAFAAEVVEFSTQADPATQTYRGRVSIERPQGTTILPGMVGQVVITQENSSLSRLAVPASAVAADPAGATFVWVVSLPDNIVQKRAVEIGEARGSTIEVRSGLSEGDTVVTAGVSHMRADMVVRPITEVTD
jgi:membrane fusion protein, multidrug efflux system